MLPGDAAGGGRGGRSGEGRAARHHRNGGDPRPSPCAAARQPVDPLQLILWENAGYLIDDARRRDLFDAFGEKIGFDAARIAAADDDVLLALASAGGMRPEERVERWRAIAGIVLEDCQGDLDRHLRALPVAKARTFLRRFPSIGAPGADKILLFAGIAILPFTPTACERCAARLLRCPWRLCRRLSGGDRHAGGRRATRPGLAGRGLPPAPRARQNIVQARRAALLDLPAGLGVPACAGDWDVGGGCRAAIQAAMSPMPSSPSLRYSVERPIPSRRATSVMRPR